MTGSWWIARGQSLKKPGVWTFYQQWRAAKGLAQWSVVRFHFHCRGMVGTKILHACSVAK